MKIDIIWKRGEKRYASNVAHNLLLNTTNRDTPTDGNRDTIKMADKNRSFTIFKGQFFGQNCMEWIGNNEE